MGVVDRCTTEAHALYAGELQDIGQTYWVKSNDDQGRVYQNCKFHDSRGGSFCLFVRVSRPTREFLIYMETSPLSVKGSKFWPMLCTNGHWAGVFVTCHTYCDTGHPFYNDHLRGSVPPTHIAERYGSGAVSNCFYDLGLSRRGFKHPTFGLWHEHSDQLRHRQEFLCYGVTI